MTAAAKTGPARQPRPASSKPASVSRGSWYWSEHQGLFSVALMMLFHISSAAFSHVYLWELMIPCWERRRRSAPSLTRRAIAPAMASAPAGPAQSAAPPLTSGSDDVSERMHGVPQRIASTTGMPKPSNQGTNVSASAPPYSLRKTSRLTDPVKIMSPL